MNQVQRNPGCLRECRLDRAVESGFVIEAGCPVHDREGYRPFVVGWLGPNPCLLGTLSLCHDEGAKHEHVLVASFLMGLN